MPSINNTKRALPWSAEEIHTLIGLYPIMFPRELIKKFPHRNKATLIAKAWSLRIPSAKSWRPEENQILKHYFINASREELKELLPKRSWSAILAQGERLMLKRNTAQPRIEVNEKYFRTWSPNMAYILGFISADGCIIQGTYKGYSDALVFGIHKRDKDILEKIKRELNAKHTISAAKDALHLTITSQIMVEDLKRLKISYRKSLREEVYLPPETGQHAKILL